MALEKIVKNSSGVPTGEYERIAGGTLYADNPIGAIVPFGGTDIPAGFLLCNGAEVLKTDYAELYAVIGDAFGTASVNTKFVLPDLREATTKGAGLTGHTVGNHLDADGLAVGEFLDDRVQTHEHYIGDSATPQHLGYSDLAGQNAGIGNRTVDATIESDRKWIALGQTNVGIARSGRYGDTTEVKSVGVNYIIKAKMVALPADFLAKVGEVCSGKADKVSSATAGDIASLDANGNLVDSGVAASNVIRRVNISTPDDCNNLIDVFSEYRVGEAVTNRPTADTTAYILRTFRSGASSTTYSQIAYRIGGIAIYRRYCNSSGVWSSWEKLVTESDITTTQITGIVKADNDYTVNAYKSGKVVTVIFNANKSGTWTLNQQLATGGLPIPAGNGYQGLIMTTDGNAVGLSVTGEGALIVGYPSAREGWLFGSITYVCQ